MAATIPGYQLDQPTEASLIAALSTAIGADTARALVQLTTKKLGPYRASNPDDLIRLTEALMEIGDHLRVTAPSEKIRAVTHRALHAAVR